MQFWNGCELLYGLKRSSLNRAHRVLSMAVAYRFGSGLWTNLYRLFWGTVGFQDCFAILDRLEADIWTKNESIG